MTCFAYDDVDSWRSIYPKEIFERQLALLCDKWREGLALLEEEEYDEMKIIANAAIGFEAENQYYFFRDWLVGGMSFNNLLNDMPPFLCYDGLMRPVSYISVFKTGRSPDFPMQSKVVKLFIVVLYRGATALQQECDW